MSLVTMNRKCDRKERFFSLNHLTGLVQCLINQNVLIDLQNETSVAGTITNVDGYMNVSMKTVVYIDQLGQQFPMDNFMILPKYIRYVHIPKEPNIDLNLANKIRLKKSLQAFAAGNQLVQYADSAIL
ncbi:U7 snRNA-associated Sm-like protein LSm10 [Anopheles coustani]|uniref:U7 snRNA-associated Sm-like protein LSm10 n=1 Tax=Anopheles coustani TaxID=139045 RepID=UPI00265AB46B|nr:U7 snRNA-associated Sm-like protein LSm10 [Anopheles coustani]